MPLGQVPRYYNMNLIQFLYCHHHCHQWLQTFRIISVHVISSINSFSHLEDVCVYGRSQSEFIISIYKDLIII